MQRAAQSSAPKIRRAHSKMLVRILRDRSDFEALASDAADRVDFEALSRGFNMSWGDLLPYTDLLQFLFERLGRDGLVDLWEQSFTTLMAQPFLAAFIDLIRPRPGTSIGEVARRAPAVYAHIARDCGVLQWSPTLGGGGSLALHRFPDGYPIEPWCLSVLGCMRAAAATLDFDPGAVTFALREPSNDAVFRVRSEHSRLAKLGA